MKTSRIMLSSLAAASLLGTSACVTDPNTGERKVSRTAIGGVGGAVLGGLLGGAIGGKTGRIVGAVAGGAAGGYAGYTMDQQIKELKEETEGSGVEVLHSLHICRILNGTLQSSSSSKHPMANRNLLRLSSHP